MPTGSVTDDTGKLVRQFPETLRSAMTVKRVALPARGKN